MMDHPLCLNCGKKLQRYRYRRPDDLLQWGGCGDNHFCGKTCGWKWALMWLARHPLDAAALHDAMPRVMAKRAEGSP
jgi:hypothetical protein